MKEKSNIAKANKTNSENDDLEIVNDDCSRYKAIANSKILEEKSKVVWIPYSESMLDVAASVARRWKCSKIKAILTLVKVGTWILYSEIKENQLSDEIDRLIMSIEDKMEDDDLISKVFTSLQVSWKPYKTSGGERARIWRKPYGYLSNISQSMNINTPSMIHLAFWKSVNKIIIDCNNFNYLLRKREVKKNIKIANEFLHKRELYRDALERINNGNYVVTSLQ